MVKNGSEITNSYFIKLYINILIFNNGPYILITTNNSEFYFKTHFLLSNAIIWKKKLTNSLLTKQSDKLLFHTFDDTLKPQIEELLSLGKSAGADIVEIFLEKSDNIVVS